MLAGHHRQMPADRIPCAIVSSPISVCFATPGVGVLFERERSIVGGSEQRALRLATGLARNPGFQVSLIAALRDGQQFDTTLERVTVLPLVQGEPPRSLLLRLLRRVRARIASDVSVRWAAARALWQTANADVYLTIGVADHSAALSEWCRSAGRKFVLMLGSELDVSGDYRPGDRRQNVYGSRHDLCYRALAGADLILAQTERQARLLQERFALTAAVLPNPIAARAVAAAPRRHVLWVGKSDRVKRPDIAVAAARALDDVAFVMVMNRVDEGIDRRVRETAGGNVRIIDFVDPDAMCKLMAEATALINTSDFEGFPNTFLEAGMQETPVVSLNVDPDGLLAASGGGFAANGNFTRFLEAIRIFHRDETARERAGRALRDYVTSRHAETTVLERLGNLLRALASGRETPELVK